MGLWGIYLHMSFFCCIFAPANNFEGLSPKHPAAANFEGLSQNTQHPQILKDRAKTPTVRNLYKPNHQHLNNHRQNKACIGVLLGDYSVITA